jgi:hypothetical protein
MNLAVPQFAARPVEQAHAAVGVNQAIFDSHVTGADVLPPGKVFAIKKLLPVVGLGVNMRANSQHA